MKNNEIATTQQDSSFLMLTDFDLATAMREELAGLDGSFERIKIPAGGSTVFEVPGEEPGKTDAVKEFSAVILFHHPLHAFYRDSYTGGNNPPDCGSYDGLVGVGFPGGECAVCPHNQFGSAENGGKACKNRRRIYVLREGELLPLLLSLPTGSLKEYSRYIKRLLGKGRMSNMVVTRFSLQKATNAGGLVYSQAQFALERALSIDELALINPLSKQMKKHSQTVAFVADANEGSEVFADAPPLIDPDTGEILSPLA